MTQAQEQLHRAVELHQAGSLAEAERLYQQILRSQPGNAEAVSRLGVLYCQSERCDEGIQLLRDAAATNPNDQGIHYNLANALREAGEFESAAEHYQQSIQLRPDHVSSHVNLGAALQELGRLEEAAACYGRALELDGSHSPAQLNLADVLWRLDRRPQAISALRQAIVIDPTCLQALQYLGTALLVEREYQAASDVWQSAIRMNPTCADYHHNLAQSLEGLGELEQAEDAYRDAIGLAPGLLPTRHALARLLARRSSMAESVGSYQAALQLATGDTSLRATLLFELGTVLDQLRECDHAFDCYRGANALRGREINWNDYCEEVEQTLATFCAETLPQLPRTIRGTDRAVFIVATPGSESLVRSILAHHPDVHNGGATNLLARAAASIGESCTPTQHYPGCVKHLTVDDVHRLADSMAQQADQLCVTRRRIVDSSTNNAAHLGLASLIAPHARVIWIQRDPVQAGLACFCDPRPFMRDLNDVGRYIALNNAMMQHWTQVLDLSILTVRWEDLVADPMAAARQIIEFVDLPWNDRCTPTQTATLPDDAGTGPDRYGPFLEPLIKAIETPFQPAHPEAA